MVSTLKEIKSEESCPECPKKYTRTMQNGMCHSLGEIIMKKLPNTEGYIVFTKRKRD